LSASIKLPGRREEAWRWSDLRTIAGDVVVPVATAGVEGHAVIRQLADGVGAFDAISVAAGETRAIHDTPASGALAATGRQINVGQGASVSRVLVQTGSDITLDRAEVEVAESGVFRQFTIALGGRLARLETDVRVVGAGARVELAGIYLAGDGCHADLTSRVEHHGVGAETRQLTKGAVRAGGRGVFQGKFLVGRGAQQTDARQHHQALLLDEKAEVFAKPELEIYADDVACAHGNTAGALDEAALFYMRQRGLPLEAARALLVEAFLIDAIPDWLDHGTRAVALGMIRDWLEGAP
jgi:Fe-S cluster assembly protein SufD